MSVLFPAPFSPKSASTSPECTSRSTPRKLCTPGNDFLIPRMESSGIAEGSEVIGKVLENNKP